MPDHDDARARLVQAGLDVTDALPLTKVFAGTTTAKVADAAGVTTGSFFHHFANQAEFIDALVTTVLFAPEDLADHVDEIVDALAHIDLFETLQTSLLETWEVHSGDARIRQSLRLQLQLWAHHDQALAQERDGMADVADVLRENYRRRHDQAAAGWRHLLSLTGRDFVGPFDLDRIAIALTGLFEGLLIRHQVDPDAVDDQLFADVAATLATALTVPRGSRVRLGDVVDPDAPLVDRSDLSPQARSGARRRRATRARITAAATGMFAEGWESVPATEVASAADVSHQTVLNLFDSVREVAASTFVRHVPGLLRLATETESEEPLVALHRVLSLLADSVSTEPGAARALLSERVKAKQQRGGELAQMDIRLEVPIAQAVLPSLERLDLDDREPIQVASTLCDTVLSLALDRMAPRGDVAALAMQLLPAAATGVTHWTPPRSSHLTAAE